MAQKTIENITSAMTLTRLELRERFAKVLQMIETAKRQAISTEYVCGLLAAAEMFEMEFAAELIKRASETTSREHFARKKRVARQAKKNAKQGVAKHA